MGRTLVGNMIVDLSDIVGASPASSYISIRDLTPGFNGLGRDNCKRDEKHLSFGIWRGLYYRFSTQCINVKY